MINKDPIITVYITNKNYGIYLDKAIKSVFDQSFKELELIVIDDGSSDFSGEIIKKYKKKNFKVIYNKISKGLIKSSNIAIKAARGEYVIRLDADDYLDPNACQCFIMHLIKMKTLDLFILTIT